MEPKEQILSKFSSFSKQDQIEIILNSFIDARTMLSDQSVDITWGDIAKGFTVTEEDIFAYIQEHKSTQQYSYTKDDSHDGVYIIEENGKYKYFNQERGIRLRENIFDSYDEALMDLIKDKIKLYTDLKK